MTEKFPVMTEDINPSTQEAQQSPNMILKKKKKQFKKPYPDTFQKLFRKQRQ